MQVRWTGVAVDGPPLLSSCNDTNPLFMSDDNTVSMYRYLETSIQLHWHKQKRGCITETAYLLS